MELQYIKICPKCLYVTQECDPIEMDCCKYCNTTLITSKFTMKERTKACSYKDRYRRRPEFDEAAWRRQLRLRMEEQRQLEQPPTPTLTTCPVCQGKLSTAATACPHCGQPMSQGKPVQAVQQAPVQLKHEENVPRCPTCSSTNIRKLDVIDRGLSFAVWGIFSSKIGKSMMCKDCGYKW